MVDWIMYAKIQEQKRNGLNKSQTARKLKINRETVRTYWDMTPGEYAIRVENAKTRTKKADNYKEFVVECLKKYPDMSASQIYDWIKEKSNLESLMFQERTFRNFVKTVREEYGIKKICCDRQYEAVDELPPGRQGQVDMGEIKVTTINGRAKKIYCFGMVLSHSRQKFVLWQEHPFTTESFIAAHVKAFEFYGGRPREIVYDQDKVLAVSENHGDIIYTEGFQNYINEVKFDIYLCRGADPESKGKIENVVKYAKNHFAKHRVFTDIDNFNADCMAWLNRTANAKEHGTIKKIPAEVFALERESLIPVSHYSFETAVNESIPYQVRKDNIVLYKGNRYRVPKGTYYPGKKVFMVVNDDILSITDCITGEIYATHPLCKERGRLIGQKRQDRDTSKTLLEQELIIKEMLGNDAIVKTFLEHIHQEKSRYYRDQLGVIRKLFDKWDKELILAGLNYCCEKGLYSAGDLKSSIVYLEQLKTEKEPTKLKPVLPLKYRGNIPQKRDLSVYEFAMRGVL